MAEGQKLGLGTLTPVSHETQPPARYTEASLVKRLEELGVGRPSTYASIIGTILDRGYVWKRGTALVPSFRAFAVVGLLEQHFGDLVDYAFTARMEDELDEIAGGKQSAVPWLERFYFGVKAEKQRPLDMGLRALVSDQLERIDARAINTLPIGPDDDGVPILARVGRFGAYLSRGEDTASIPEDLAPDELTLDKAKELLSAPSGERILGNDPKTDLVVYAKTGRFGAYVQLGEHTDDGEKPRTSSLLKTQKPDTVTLEEALALLALPRLVGRDPSDGKDISAQLGRFGPYISKEKDSRSLETEDQVFSVNLEEALVLFAQPRRRGARKAVEPLRELGEDPVSKKVITLREGRFGLYVTDGETNASLRKEDDPGSLTPERAQELLQVRRETAPLKKKPMKRAGASKKTSKKASSKASAKKASAKPAKPAEEGQSATRVVKAKAKKASAKRAPKAGAGKAGAGKGRSNRPAASVE
jgi:DNA topoisomerase-1